MGRGSALLKFLPALPLQVLCSLSLANLDDAVTTLQGGDQRIVRPSPGAKTARLQWELGDDEAETFLAALQGSDARQQELALEMVILLTTNKPENRATFGAMGVVQAAAQLLKSPSNSEIAAKAAEAVWILSYGGGEQGSGPEMIHLEYRAEGVVQTLAEMVMHSEYPKARMWAAAALGNLAAAYDVVDKQSSEEVRQDMVDYEKGKLLEALLAMVNKGPVSESTKVWPSRATTADGTAESIEAWGAGQALKNLALSKASHSRLKALGIVESMCKMKQSPDWLEKMKAEATLQNLGSSCENEL